MGVYIHTRVHACIRELSRNRHQNTAKRVPPKYTLLDSPVSKSKLGLGIRLWKRSRAYSAFSTASSSRKIRSSRVRYSKKDPRWIHGSLRRPLDLSIEVYSKSNVNLSSIRNEPLVSRTSFVAKIQRPGPQVSLLYRGKGLGQYAKHAFLSNVPVTKRIFLQLVSLCDMDPDFHPDQPPITNIFSVCCVPIV